MWDMKFLQWVSARFEWQVIHACDLPCCRFQTDFLLVLLHDMVRAFPQLKVILMSATIDTSMFVEYFGSTQVVEVQGRVHPVQGQWGERLSKLWAVTSHVVHGIHSSDYYLEDIVQMLDFMPPAPDKKDRKRKAGDDDDDDDALAGDDKEVSNLYMNPKRVELPQCLAFFLIQENCNMQVSPDYNDKTRRAMAMMSEKDLQFELITVSDPFQGASVLISLISVSHLLWFVSPRAWFNTLCLWESLELFSFFCLGGTSFLPYTDTSLIILS